MGHYRHELFEIELAIAVGVKRGDGLLDFVARCGLICGLDELQELLGVDAAVFVCVVLVEQVL